MFNASMKTIPLQTKPYMVNGEEQRSLFLGLKVSMKASTEQTGGAFNLFDVLCPVDYETPLHIHYVEDVAIFVLEGALEIFWGNEKKKAPANSYFFQPKGTPHGFRVEGNSTARVLYMTIPAGFDRFVSECTDSAACLGVIAAARYKIEILGPLPGAEKQ
jgi:quercetin dioxygenase-like cupin family protein